SAKAAFAPRRRLAGSGDVGGVAPVRVGAVSGPPAACRSAPGGALPTPVAPTLCVSGLAAPGLGKAGARRPSASGPLPVWEGGEALRDGPRAAPLRRALSCPMGPAWPP